MHLALQACLAAVILAGTCYLVSLDSGYSVQSKFMSDSIDVPLTHTEPPTTGTVGQNPSPRGTNHPKDPRKEPGTSQPKNKTEPSPSETPQKNETGTSPPETTHEQPQTETPSENPTENTETPSQSGGSSTEGEDIDEGSLKSYPPAGSAKSPTHSRRKDQRKISLCRITGENCQRFRPVEELPTFWLICVLYAADQQATELLYQHHRDFINYAKLFGFRTQAIEVIFPGQEYKITEPNKQPEELQYKADWIFNMRENLVNVGAKKLPDDWQYIAWIDAHIFWDENRYFFEDVVVELNKNNIVHMLGSNDFYDGRNVSNFHEEGFAKLWHQMHTSYLPPIRQCGMAWATRRDVFERNGGVLDVCIGTKCDLYQNYPMIGETYTGECSNPEYANAVRSWQQNAIKVFEKKVGYVKGNIVHFQHCIGKCKTSSYDLMTSALMQYNFNPNTDMVRDEEGRMQFKSNWGLAKRLWEIYGGAPRN